jgi:hypothetical protein
MLPRLGAIPRALALPVLLLALVGCAPEPEPWPSGTPTPTPEATPLWADDDEALEMAVAAYQEYLDVGAEILADGGRDPERIRELVLPDDYPSEVDEFEELQRRGVRYVGRFSLSNPQRQRVDDDGVSFSICWDRTSVRELDGDGNDVTDPNRLDVVPQIVGVRIHDSQLVIEEVRDWSVISYCS